MTETVPSESALLQLLDHHKGVLDLGGSAEFGAQFGVVLSLRGRPLGVWSHGLGHFVFRDLSNYTPVFAATSMDEAVEFSLQLLKTCQNGWAERLGDLPCRGRAA